MKNIYNVLVFENYTTKMESILNHFQVGLNDWDRSKAMDLHGERVVNYTIACTEDTYTSIWHTLNAV